MNGRHDGRIDHDDEKTDAIGPGDGCDLNDQGVIVLGVGQQAPGQGQKRKIGSGILQYNPDKRGCDIGCQVAASLRDKAVRPSKKCKKRPQIDGQQAVMKSGVSLYFKIQPKMPKKKSIPVMRDKRKASTKRVLVTAKRNGTRPNQARCD